jgi:la-related protein 1
VKLIFVRSESSVDDLRRATQSPDSSVNGTGASSEYTLWARDSSDISEPLPEGSESELYSDVRQRALDSRKNGGSEKISHDMKVLYEFWSHFLIRNFNAKVYAEFQELATEDATNKSNTGMDRLISYYDEALKSTNNIIPEDIAKQYINLIKGETGEHRPAFEKLKTAWTNNSLTTKNRKQIGAFIDGDLKAELDV